MNDHARNTTPPRRDRSRTPATGVGDGLSLGLAEPDRHWGGDPVRVPKSAQLRRHQMASRPRQVLVTEIVEDVDGVPAGVRSYPAMFVDPLGLLEPTHQGEDDDRPDDRDDDTDDDLERGDGAAG